VLCIDCADLACQRCGRRIWSDGWDGLCRDCDRKRSEERAHLRPTFDNQGRFAGYIDATTRTSIS
jgi:hypothetical protein